MIALTNNMAVGDIFHATSVRLPGTLTLTGRRVPKDTGVIVFPILMQNSEVIYAYPNKGKCGPLLLIKVLQVLLMRVFTTHQLINFGSDDNRIAPVEDGRAGEWRADDPRSDPIRWLTIARYVCRSGAVHSGPVEIWRSRLWSWLDS